METLADKKTLHSIAELRSIAATKIKELRKNRSKWKQMLGSNETCIDHCERAKMIFNEVNQSTSDSLDKLRKYQEAIKYYLIGLGVAQFKETAIKNQFEKCKNNYLSECKAFLQDGLNQPHTANIPLLKEALTALTGEQFPTYEYLKQIDEIELLQTKTNQILKELKEKSFLYSYEKTQVFPIDEIVEIYKKIVFYEKKPQYKSFFDEIKKEISAIYEGLIQKIEKRITKEKGKKHPSIEILLQLFKGFAQLEDDFEIFLCKQTDKYHDEAERLKTLQNDIFLQTEKIDTMFKNLPVKTKPIEKMILLEQIYRTIEMTLVSISFDYKEISEDKSNLEECKKEVNKLAEDIIEATLDNLHRNCELEKSLPFTTILNQYQEAIGSLESYKTQFTVIPIIRKKIENQIEKTKKKFKHCLLEKQAEQNKFDNYQEYLGNLQNMKKAYSLLADDTEVDKYASAIQKLEIERTEFETKYNAMKSELEKDVKTLPQKQFIAIYKESEQFIIRYKNSILAKLKPYNTYIKTIEEFQGQQKELMNKFIDENAIQGKLSLVHSITGRLYHFIPDEIMSIGRNDSNQCNTIEVPIKSVSRSHLLLDFGKNCLIDRNSANGTFINEDGDTRVDRNNFSEIREFNLALNITFTLSIIPQKFAMIRIKAITNPQAKFTCPERPEDWVKKMKNVVFLKIYPDTPIFLDKRNGMLAESAMDAVNYLEIVYENGMYFFSDNKEDIVHMPILKSGNQLLSFYLDGE
jgi:hypothetical protein